VRSGLFLGRFHEKRGDVDAAIAIYREIVAIDRDGLTARRLTVLLSRRGEFQEASEFAAIASTSKLNLFPRLPANNRYIASLETEFLGK
jgi:tetratricopeptide (TPR) repeat protein